MTGQEPSRRLVDQRLRNRIIEQLSYLCRGDEGVRLKGASEWFEAFFDYFPYEGQSFGPNIAISGAEWRALLPVVEAMQQACCATPNDIDEDGLIGSGWPKRVSSLAEHALEIFEIGGRSLEQTEEDST